MKFGFLLLILLSSLLLESNLAKAADEPCQFDLLKPKMVSSIIKKQSEEHSQLTVAEINKRLLNKQQLKSDDSEKSQNKQQVTQSSTEQPKDKDNAEATEKQSGLGGIFDILLPSALRNPVK